MLLHGSFNLTLDANPFVMIFLVILLVAFYVSHSLFAAHFFKEKIQSHIPFVFKYYRLIYSLFSIAFLSYIIWFFIQKHEYDFLIYTNLELFKFLGFLFMATGVVIVSISVLKYGAFDFIGLSVFSKTQNTEKPALITSGLNKIVRHPIYTGLLLIMLGLFFILPTKMTLAFIIISISYLEVGIRLEERKLNAEFGDAYKKYQERVKKIIPFIY